MKTIVPTGHDKRGVYARVWSTPSSRVSRHSRRTWHFAVYSSGGEVILYDNTGSYQIILRDALIRVEALRHMEIAGHKLKAYRGSY